MTEELETTETSESSDTKQKPKITFSQVRTIGSILLLVAVITLTGYYVLFPSRGYFHSDTTDTIMWAEASYDAGKLFNPDFSYACLLPFGANLIMTALMPITGVSMTTHVIGMFCFFLMFTGSLILMLRQMGWKWGWISLTVFWELMVCSGSEKLREIFWGHTIYYSLGILFIYAGLAMLFRHMNIIQNWQKADSEQQKKTCKIHFICCTVAITVWFLLTGMNQISAITIFSLPVIGAVFCERWFDSKTKILSLKNGCSLAILVLMAVATVGGYALTNHLAGDIHADYAESFSKFTDMGTWNDHIHQFMTAYFSLIDIGIAGGKPMMSGESVIGLLTIIMAVLMQILPLIAIFFWNKIQDSKLKILLLTYWFMDLLVMMGYVFGMLSVANWRLSPIVAFSVVASAGFLQWAFSQVEWQRLAVLLLIPALVVSTANTKKITSMPADNTSRNALYMLAQELENRNLSYGYATFWKANALTIISDSKVKCRAIEIGDSGAVINQYQGNKHWYEDQPNQEKYFVLFSKDEADRMKQLHESLDPEVLEVIENTPHISILSETEERIELEGYEIWVFKNNIFS